VVTAAPTEQIFYYINDHLGTPQKMIDEVETVVWEASYKPFGKADLIINQQPNNFGFPGQYYDTETGLYYNYYRYYDSQGGRYIRSDPAEFAGGDINLFTYCWNSPKMFYDPLGLGAKGDAVGIVLTMITKANRIKNSIVRWGVSIFTAPIGDAFNPDQVNRVPEQELMETDIDADGIPDFIDDTDNRIQAAAKAHYMCLAKCKLDYPPKCQPAEYDLCRVGCYEQEVEFRSQVLWTNGKRNWKMTNHDLKQ